MDELDAAAVAFDQRDRKIGSLSTQVADLKKTVKALTAECEREKHRSDFILATAGPLALDPIRPSSKSDKVREASPVVLLSDLHLEERVTLASTNGLNEFNLEIAKERMRSYARGVEWYCKMLATGDVRYRMRRGVIASLGDIITGYIHPEYVMQNQLSPQEAALFAETLICEFIEYIAKRSGVPEWDVIFVHGNHDRDSERDMPSALARRSFSWSIGHHVAREFRDKKNIRFQIAESIHVYHDVMGHKVRFTHGTSIKYRDGVGGLSIPANKAISGWDHGIRAKVTAHGHLHTIGDDPQRASNGSLIGYNPFGIYIKVKPEPAAQAVFSMDPEYGKRFFVPIVVQDT